MAPRTSTVLRTRWILRVALRLAAAGAAMLFLCRVFDHVGGNWEHGFSYIFQFGVLHNLSPLAGAALLFLLDIFALRYLVPPGHWQCPRCGYDLENVDKPKCPECGQRLSDEVVSPSAAEDSA